MEEQLSPEVAELVQNIGFARLFGMDYASDWLLLVLLVGEEKAQELTSGV